MPALTQLPTTNFLRDYDVSSAPRQIAGPGRLHMRFPVSRSAGRPLAFLRSSSLDYSYTGGLISVRVPDALPLPALEMLAATLTPPEQSEVWVIFEPDGEPFELADYFETGSLSRFLARQQSGWLIDMIRQNRLTSVFQPIVGAGHATLFGYECLLRGIDGAALVACSRMLQIAGASGLLFQMDLAARYAAIREAVRHGIREKIFINFTPTVFDDALEGLRQTVAMVDELGVSRSQIVFEVVESERIVDLGRLEQVLSHYRKLGFEVALDDVGSGYSSLHVLQRVRPDYLKLDLQLIRHVDRDSYKAVLTSKLLEASQTLKIRTIAEGVETPGECAWLQVHGADYMQGHFFARPASPPPAILYAA